MPALTPQPNDRAGDGVPDHSWIRTLEAFGIPFLCYAADGRRSYASPAAEALLEVEPFGVIAGVLADQAATDLSWASLPATGGQFVLIRELPSWTDGIVLAVHASRPPAGPGKAVIVIRPAAHRVTQPTLPGLTRREADVARLVAAGLPTKVVAYRLGISQHTTRHHTERVFEKLGVRSRAGVAALVAGRMSTPRMTGSTTPSPAWAASGHPGTLQEATES